MALSRAVCRRLCEHGHTFEDAWDEKYWASWTRPGKPGWHCHFGRCKLWEVSAAPIGCPFVLEHLFVTKGDRHYEEPYGGYSIETENDLLVRTGVSAESVVQQFPR